MKLERIRLENFRSYEKQEYRFGERTIIVAPNGAGKTNLLEAIYLLLAGESERASVTEEMITWEKPIATVNAVLEVNGNQELGIRNQGSDYIELTVILTRGSYMGKVTPKRRYLVDGVARTKAKFVGKLPVTLFRPEDMRLVEGSPPRRRNFLDESLTQAHPEYARALTVYEASLRRRNKLLDAIREGVARREQLTYWDQSVIKNGNIVSNFRREFLLYLSRVSTSFGKFKLEYLASEVSPERLTQYAEAEVAVGYTLVGPHKDDFKIFQEGKDLMVYGSRGEQRLGVLFMKMAAMKYVEEKLKIKSLLLLDDIFSELDQLHREEVVVMMEGRQTIVTSAEEEATKLVKGAEVVRLTKNTLD
ncbi:MAG: replication and repair protein RecF protein [Microgenomates group bacterium GW2011_GWC1_46_16]|uniref:DNA replication and repair protein RecF n=2 Tax=Candidatus Collieribacteriota TaxID=1752725 RepID=A0A1F5FYM5_9BACT|nr:MAG: replication and repair protein RecF protein [Microgenomates group bacterium GW2011_GWF1_46_12]KKU26750.1 MAG: replication and repair protein RecF protein [Microgenomates group bacterium GW2011_GWC1_46_16]KKU27985.1 MAG: replication and repair protein RecF protein [Microgenomates group bacterium GW2011_GWF2_46_18]KKU44218.1 MAG: replication and repair protein RecF protein [Microgenomates group bacterium GW2011_GWA1_46_7]KKU45659.1 MAG: replication and repair protein RecF protein [Microge